MAKTKSTHQVHAMLVTFSVVAGLALAACQPQLTNNKNEKKMSPEQAAQEQQQLQQVVTSPVPNETVPPTDTMPANGAVHGEVQGVSDPSFDATLQQMDNSMQQLDPNQLNGSDLQ
jgi:hypothetical protein